MTRCTLIAAAMAPVLQSAWAAPGAGSKASGQFLKKCCRDLAGCCEMDAIHGKRSAACCKELEAAVGMAIAAHDRLVLPTVVGHGVMPVASHHP